MKKTAEGDQEHKEGNRKREGTAGKGEECSRKEWREEGEGWSNSQKECRRECQEVDTDSMHRSMGVKNTVSGLHPSSL